MRVLATSLLLILTWAAQQSQCGVLPQEPAETSTPEPLDDYVRDVCQGNPLCQILQNYSDWLYKKFHEGEEQLEILEFSTSNGTMVVDMDGLP